MAKRQTKNKSKRSVLAPSPPQMVILRVCMVLLALLLVLTADSFFTVRLLRRTHNVDLLGLPNLLAALR